VYTLADLREQIKKHCHMIRSHRIRLNPTPEQVAYFARACGTRRFVFNWGLAEWQRQYAAGEQPSALVLKKQFNAIKREQFPWVYAVTKCVVEGAFMDLGEAFAHFLQARKTGKKVGYPRFKSKKRSKDGFYVANDKFRLQGHRIQLPHIGWVNMAERLRFDGKVMSARITRSAKWWFVSIAVEVEPEAWVHQWEAVGVDVGVNRLATLSDGGVLENQKPLRSLLRKVKRLNRALSRKQEGSRNATKAKAKLARAHYRIACIREDALQKATAEIADGYGFVAVETLNVRGMMQNRALAQALGDAALARFLELLEQKVAKRGGTMQAVGRFYPSSKTCSCCGQMRETLTLAERTFVCAACGAALDRDLNAATNILREGRRLRAGNRQNTCTVTAVATTDVNACGQTVRPSAFGQAARLNEAGTDLMDTFVYIKGSSMACPTARPAHPL
jgi:putative transposase